MQRDFELSGFAAFFGCDVYGFVFEVEVGPFEHETFAASHSCLLEELKEYCSFFVATFCPIVVSFFS